MKAVRNFVKRGEADCPIAVALHSHGRYLPHEPHYHPELEIAYIRQGSVTCFVEEQPIHLSAGNVLILSPNQVHLYQSPTKDAVIQFLIFSLDAMELPESHIFQKEFVQPLRDGILELPQKLDMSHPAFEQAVEKMNRPYDDFISDPYYKLNRFNAMINFCLALLPWCKRREEAMPTRGSGNFHIGYAIQYIHNWYFRPLTLSMIAKKAYLDPTYLSTLFHKKTGQTVMQYLTRIRLDAAVQLLRSSNLNISQIAEQTGFQSESTFYQQFRKAMGTSPRAFRQALHKDTDD